MDVQSILIMVLGIYGLLLISVKDIVLPTQLKTPLGSFGSFVYDNNIIIGGILVVSAYYLYISTSTKMSDLDSSDMTSATPDVPLPSYLEATSET